MRTLEERFWNKVDKTSGECWLWRGSKNHSGYGLIGASKTGKNILAHRLSLEWKLGRKIGEGMVSRHMCRNKNCVNPNHLEEGTHTENMADKVRDGTTNRGTQHHRCKLTEEQVLMIRADQRLLREIATEYGVSLQTIGHIKSGRNWKHLPPIKSSPNSSTDAIIEL